MTKIDNCIDLQNSRPTQNNFGFVYRVWLLLIQPWRIFPVIRDRVFGRPKSIDWDLRVKELGCLSVKDSRHLPDEYEYVTRRQKEILYPYFLDALNGSERVILDFGCGAGRFTSDLAKLINGEAVGIDPTAKLIEMCPYEVNIEYMHDEDFFENNHTKYDIVWISLVLGGLSEVELSIAANNIQGVLAEDGLLFLVESTGPKYIEGLWRIRTQAQLFSIFPSVTLKTLGTYYDAKQEISIIAGRKLLGAK
jgi:SAM-dependent methyltransferase